MSSYCTNCGESTSEDNSHWYNDEVYCESCFYDSYTYCNRCDEAVNRDYCHYDGDGDAICSSCWEDDVDDNAPVNPEVNDSEREQILNLCKCWLKGEKPKTLIRINRSDYRLEEIQTGVGLVDHALYLYGLADREEYQIKASPDIIEIVRTQISELRLEAIVIEDTGHHRLAISRTLRENNLEEIIQLIKSIHNSEFNIHNLRSEATPCVE
jgi:hypothetical protein